MQYILNKMKYKGYLIALGIIILLSGLLLLFYYTQDFTEEINIPDSIKYEDIEIKTTQIASVNHLMGAIVDLGEIKLENHGYFTQLYSIPQLIGCINLIDGASKDFSSIKFNIETGSYSTIDNPKLSYYNYNQNQLKIRVGDSKTIKLQGVFSGRNERDQPPMSIFSADKIENLEVYKIPKKESNPLSNEYRSSYSYNQCESLKSELTPIKTLLIDF